MSFNINPLKVVQVRDPVTIINNERYYAILQGGSVVSYKPFTTTSISNSSIQFTAPPPNPNIIVDRKLYFNLPVRLIFQSSAPNANNLLRAGYDAPRFMPISSSLNTLSSTLNNITTSINMADIIHALLHYNTDHVLKEHDYSLTPSCPDQSQNYDDLVGAIRNPLGGYGDSNDESVMGRGGFAKYNIVVNTPSLAVIDCIFTENLFLSPYYWGCDNASGFIGLQTMDYNLTFLQNAANRMWSHATGGALAPGAITSSQIAFNNFTALNPAPFSYGSAVPQLLYKYITPSVLQTIPRSVVYPYFNVDRYPSDFTSALAPNAETTLVSQNIQLKSIPRRMYIYARNNNSTLYSAPSFTDTYLAITGITVNWNNNQGLLSSARPEDLYKISVKNHCNLSYTQWSGGPVYQSGSFVTKHGTIGSVLCLEFATDIGLAGDEAPGLLGTYQLQMNVNVRNVNQTQNVTPVLMIVVVSEGTFTIEDNRAVTQVGVISKQDILDARMNMSPYVNYEDIQRVNGGDFLSGLRKFGENVFHGIKGALSKAYEIGQKIAPYVKTGIDIAKIIAPLLAAGGEGELMGAGCNDCHQGYGNEIDDGMFGNGVLVGGHSGGNPVGGKMMPRKSLRDRLKQM